jgi:hypothetical protein
VIGGMPVGAADKPHMELILTMEPPPFFAICSAASFVPRNTLVGLDGGDAVPALHPVRIAD